MEIRYYKLPSVHLSRDMEFKVYGCGGKPVLFIPCQGGRFFDFEDFGMLDVWKSRIEDGICTIIACDSIDGEAWASQSGDKRRRIEQHERWFRYITLELVPQIHKLLPDSDGILAFGASMGAMHAANLYYRRPDLFDSLFAISGIYDNSVFFEDYCDDLVYQNCPVMYLANMPTDHPYMDIYHRQKSLIVVGQGAWEEPLLASTRRLDTVCCEKGIGTRFRYWGHDVDHDWHWWHEMVRVYAPEFFD